MISHSLTPGISGDQITTSNLVNSGQAAHNYGSAGNNYMIAQCSPQSTPLSLSSLMIVMDQGAAVPAFPRPAHSIIFQPEKICPENFNNENILTVKCSVAPQLHATHHR